jgi:hypothetical protein
MKYFLKFLLIFYAMPLLAQENYFTSPVKIPIFLSGSFAELRSNHFHSGIDIKTQQVTGIPIYAVADGFVSRIAVSPVGFGKALYIDHPNGTTSVYAHLDGFSKEIENYIRDIQYEKKSFRVDVKVPEGKLLVKRDQLVGKSGNSGSSGGPHLHFEIRDTESEEPLNPLRFNFPVKDNTPPRIYAVMVAPLNEFSHVDFSAEKKIFTPVLANGKYSLQDKTVIPVYGEVGIAIQAYDFFDGSQNRCGVYSVRVMFDGEEYYSVQKDRFSFDETRYINSLLDYAELMNSNRRFQKTWVDPGNRLSMYRNSHRGGNLKVTDGNIHPVKIELKDLHGNTSVLEFNLSSQYMEVPRIEIKHEKYLRFDRHNNYEAKDIKMEFPVNTLYTDLMFTYRKRPALKGLYSPVHVIHNPTVPLHSNVLLAIRPENLDRRLHEKALLVLADTITGKLSNAGGEYKEGWITGHIRNFGNYAVAVDTIPPAIVPLSFKADGTLNESSRIRFRIADELSGIKEYEGTLDGKWALFEYDAKTNMIVHYFDAQRFELGKRHKLVLTVTDNKNNKRTYETSFWK